MGWICQEALVLLTSAVVASPYYLVEGALSLQPSSSSFWQPLPHVERRTVLTKGTAAALATISASSTFLGIPQDANSAVSLDESTGSEGGVLRPVDISIDSHPAIPVWPTWGGGRVVPVSLGGPLHDPFLLLAHHKHWFDPRDPLREPFKLAGKALGLPYVDVEGFAMHPHRGFDILTYILDGSDGFRHRDSLGESTRIYRGGCAQWMRTGAGVLHEEFWETRPDRRTSIELFQLWVNLPAKRKFDPPVIQYVGQETDHPWKECTPEPGVWVRDISTTLDAALQIDNEDDDKTSLGVAAAKRRPPVTIQHATIAPGAQWTAETPLGHSSLVYVRQGTASLSHDYSNTATATVANELQTATFSSVNEPFVRIQNSQRNRKHLDLLLLTGAPLGEPVATAGPIVMNTREELNDAYRQLSNGTFLNRRIALREQAATKRSGRPMV